MPKTCQRCNGNRIASVCGKVRDLCSYSAGAYDREGYVPNDMLMRSLWPAYDETVRNLLILLGSNE